MDPTNDFGEILSSSPTKIFFQMHQTMTNLSRMMVGMVGVGNRKYGSCYFGVRSRGFAGCKFLQKNKMEASFLGEWLCANLVCLRCERMKRR